MKLKNPIESFQFGFKSVSFFSILNCGLLNSLIIWTLYCYQQTFRKLFMKEFSLFALDFIPTGKKALDSSGEYIFWCWIKLTFFPFPSFFNACFIKEMENSPSFLCWVIKALGNLQVHSSGARNTRLHVRLLSCTYKFLPACFYLTIRPRGRMDYESMGYLNS